MLSDNIKTKIGRLKYLEGVITDDAPLTRR